MSPELILDLREIAFPLRERSSRVLWDETPIFPVAVK
jgi:hypothetical protein